MSTTGTIKHRTLITGTNNPAYQVSKDAYNDTFIVASAAPDGTVMVRDSTQSDGWGFDVPTFLQSGTGAISRTVESRLRDAIHVKDFGAVANGASNPLSTRFGTLGAAQVVYPHAVALTDELDWAAAQAAVNYAITHAGGMVVFDGNYYNFNWPLIVLNATRVGLCGAGQRSQITTSTPGLEALVILRNASEAVIRDLAITVNTPGTATYGLLVTATTSTQHVEIENVVCQGDGGGGVMTNGFGIGADTAADVAQVTLVGCRGSHCEESAYLLGDGTAGNVLDIRGFGCVGLLSKYGVTFDGSAGQWYGFAMGFNSVADFRRGQMCSAPIVIDGGRSENSKRLWTTTGGTFCQPVSIRSVIVPTFTDADGIVIYHSSASPITLQDCLFYGGPEPVQLWIGLAPEYPVPFSAINVFTDGTPFAGASSQSLRAINCGQVDGDGVVILNSIRDHNGLKHQRMTTGSIGASSSSSVVVTWAVPHGDTNYTVQATVNGASLRVVDVTSVTATTVTVLVENTSGSPATGTLHVMAMHD